MLGTAAIYPLLEICQTDRQLRVLSQFPACNAPKILGALEPAGPQTPLNVQCMFLRYHHSTHSGEMFWVAMIVALVVIVGILVYAALLKWFKQQAEPIDDAERCIACGSATDRWDLAPGVYQCLCGYTGGPGMQAWEQQKLRDALDALSPDQRTKRQSRHVSRARESIDLALLELEQVTPQIQRAAMHPRFTLEGAREAMNLLEQARNMQSVARNHLKDAVRELEVAHYLAHGTDNLDSHLAEVTRTALSPTDAGEAGQQLVRDESARIRAVAASLRPLVEL